MASTREQRVDDALQQLVSRLVPSNPEEDEALDDQRWDEAIQIARDSIDNEPSPSIAEDVNHAADLIRTKLIKDTGRPEKATKFSNLYSRLLSQPVLGQKWAILYFLYHLAEPGAESIRRQLDELVQKQSSEESIRDEEPTDRERPGLGRRTGSSRTTDRQSTLMSPTFNETFSRNGLPRLPKADPPDTPKPPPTRDREMRPPRPSSGRKGEEPQDQPQTQVYTGPQRPSEAALLRDLPFTLQGLSSTHLPFSDAKILTLPPGLPVPIISLLHTLAEPSLLYRDLNAFVESSEGGLVGQSLRSAIGTELRSYLALVATLEGQIRRSLAQLDESLSHQGLGKAGVTLKRCVVWTREATMGLRLMSAIVEESRGKKGGELISLIHNFSASHGDPFIHVFADRLLTAVTKPFYDMLRKWIYDGELEDPYSEFFVYENPDSGFDMDPRRAGATSVWEDKYLLKENMIPSIMTSDFARRVYLIGKSLNFIRYSCGDSGWVEDYSKGSSRDLQYGDTATLGSSIDEAYKLTMARLIHLMEDKFNLFEHLQALKKYLLLGQGDFIALLMESLASNLDRPANSQYRHTLTAQLEHAIRNSNAQHDSPEVLRRLDARMLELSHGEIGWDVFTLEYRMDSPLDVIVTPWASKQYLKVFNFLWRIKRVEFALGQTYRRCMTGARGVLAAVDDKMGEGWKNARGGMSEMVHFVTQLQYYILFEVIEAGWEGLQAAMRKPDATLDTLISAHTSYLRSITRKGLLAPSSSSVSSLSFQQSADFTSQLHELLKLMLAYKDAVETLYSYSVAEFTRRQERQTKIETRTKNKTWGLTERDDTKSLSTPAPSRASRRRSINPKFNRFADPSDDPTEQDSPNPTPLIPLPTTSSEDEERSMLSMLHSRLSKLRAEFGNRVNVLLGDLAYQPDTDMRFLGVVMNFNDVYHPVRRKREATHGHRTARDRIRRDERDKDREKDMGKEKAVEVERGDAKEGAKE